MSDFEPALIAAVKAEVSVLYILWWKHMFKFLSYRLAQQNILLVIFISRKLYIVIYNDMDYPDLTTMMKKFNIYVDN